MSISKTFKKHIESVESLINFDREVLDIAIESIESLHQKLVTTQRIDNDQLNGKRTLDILRGIRENDSLKNRFKIINNQAIVLLVSYFGSAIADLFRQAAKIAVDEHKDERVLKTDIKMKVDELLNIFGTIGEAIGDILINKNDISFQDMKSIRRAFDGYFGIKIDKNKLVNNIILSQACRHTIVHEGGVVNKKIINQVSAAKPRDIKNDIKEKDDINFSEEEITIISKSMLSYVISLEDKVNSYRAIDK